MTTEQIELKPFCRNGHELTPKTTKIERDSRRDKPVIRCRTCRNRSNKEYRLRAHRR